MPGPVLDFTIPSAFNTLDEDAYQDGRPLSAWLGRQLQRNDRFLAANLVQCSFQKAWDIRAPNTVLSLDWVTVGVAMWKTTPGVEAITVSGRALITNTYEVYFTANSRRFPGMDGHGNVDLVTSVVGTGAAQSFSLAAAVFPGQDELVIIRARCLMESTGAADATGAVTDVDDNRIESAAAFGGVSTGWAIRLENGANARPIGDWHSVVRKESDSVLIVWPPWGPNENASGYDLSGRAQFRARQVAQLDLRSLAIDEDELTVLG